MIHSKNKGNAYERKIANEMKELGWQSCETSRYASRKTDDLKIDLVGTDPFNIQCKAMERTPNLFDELDNMPDWDKKINTIFHKKNRRGDIVVMRKEDFYRIIKALQKNGTINGI